MKRSDINELGTSEAESEDTLCLLRQSIAPEYRTFRHSHVDN